MFLEMFRHDLLYLRHRIIGNDATPNRMRTCIWLNLVIQLSIRRYVGIYPNICLDIPIFQSFYESLRIRETALVPFVGTRIRPTHPARLKADNAQRKSTFLKFGNLFIYVLVGEQRGYTMPKAQPPSWRQRASSVVKIETTYRIQHRWSTEKQHFNPFCRDQKLQIIRIRLCFPIFVTVTISHDRRVLTVFAHRRSCPYIYVTCRVD